jgi:hypothetical protein
MNIPPMGTAPGTRPPPVPTVPPPPPPVPESSFDILENLSPSEDQAMRFNNGKPELSYLLQGPKGIAGLAKVMEFGGRKYDRGNWLKGLPVNEVIDSLLRHLAAYSNGEILDPESGLPHIDHVQANAKFLAEFGDRDDKS